MDIEKMVQIEILYSQYASLLTPKQREIVSMYYEEDYSLGEISQILNISRQSVYDSLKRSENSLKEYESKLGIVEKFKNIENIVDKLAEKLEELSVYFDKDDAENSTQLKVLIEEIRELI
ncbi:YlxM family DNA-binding protein [Peptostreptococcus faecalis]|uniref:YlxM family DNA-binding protein n=1 Tax=Peptostreptococcus faecalis TaxID=2045015 RepID=UPI000C7DFD3E|nr:sigma factor-like helix-turn-helix DNA-binding protein [Peptostreptococcus faecalis]